MLLFWSHNSYNTCNVTFVENNAEIIHLEKIAPSLHENKSRNCPTPSGHKYWTLPNDNNNNSKFDIAHWFIDKSMFSGALWCAQEIKYQMQVQS